MRILGIIPARYSSTRFPGKPLAELRGRPMILHVVDNAARSTALTEVVVATDDERIADAVHAGGGTAVMTVGDFETGTDRVAWVAGRRDCDVVVNIQGDEPLLPAQALDALVEPFQSGADIDMATLASPFHDRAEVLNPRTAKVVRDGRGNALYFSRAPVPCVYRPEEGGDPEAWTSANLGEPGDYLRHIGVYAYRVSFLQRLAATPPSPLERLERLEQLRALHLGARLRVVQVQISTIGVDTPEDLIAVERAMKDRDDAIAATSAEG